MNDPEVVEFLSALRAGEVYPTNDPCWVSPAPMPMICGGRVLIQGVHTDARCLALVKIWGSWEFSDLDGRPQQYLMWDPPVLPPHLRRKRAEDLMERSSLGTDDARAMRERTPPEVARAIVERSHTYAVPSFKERLDALLSEPKESREDWLLSEYLTGVLRALDSLLAGTGDGGSSGTGNRGRSST